MKASGFSVFTVACILTITGLIVVGCSDDDNPVAPTTLKGTWTSLGSGMQGGTLGTSTRALAIYEDNLIAGGDFTTAGGVGANNIAAWDGSAWSPLGTGTNMPVFSLTSYSDYLFAGGAFTTAGGTSTNYFAAWDGSSWSSFGAGRGTFVYALLEYSVGMSEALFVGGVNGTNGGLAFFNGAQWTTMNADISVYDFAIYDNDLIIGGTFSDMGDESGDNIFAFTGMSSMSLGSGIDGDVFALAVYNGTLIAGGDFTSAGGVSVSNIAAWNGLAWVPLGEGTAGPVLDLTVFDGKLIAGGDFTHAGGIDAKHIAAWDGSSWKALGSGTDNIIMAVTSYENILIAGGQFTTAGGVSAPGIAAWDPE